MSILIKGLEMPKDDCNAVREITIENAYVDGHIQILVHDLQTGEFIGEAVEIPKHGRLIDADRLKADNSRHMSADVPYVTEETVEEIIDEAPTIIEGEEE